MAEGEERVGSDQADIMLVEQPSLALRTYGPAPLFDVHQTEIFSEA